MLTVSRNSWHYRLWAFFYSGEEYECSPLWRVFERLLSGYVDMDEHEGRLKRGLPNSLCVYGWQRRWLD